MSAWTPIARNTHALRLASARLAWYRLTGDERSLTVQRREYLDLSLRTRFAQPALDFGGDAS